MKPTLEVLKLRAEIAQLEVQLAVQRIAYDALIWTARSMLLGSPVTIEDRHTWFEQTGKLFP